MLSRIEEDSCCTASGIRNSICLFVNFIIDIPKVNGVRHVFVLYRVYLYLIIGNVYLLWDNDLSIENISSWIRKKPKQKWFLPSYHRQNLIRRHNLIPAFFDYNLINIIFIHNFYYIILLLILVYSIHLFPIYLFITFLKLP